MASKLPAGITLAELQTLAKLTAQIKKAQAKQEQLIAKAKPLFKPGTYAYEGVVVEITARTELDAETFVVDKPYETYPEFYKVAPDAKIITAKFGPLYRVVATPAMSVKLVAN